MLKQWTKILPAWAITWLSFYCERVVVNRKWVRLVYRDMNLPDVKSKGNKKRNRLVGKIVAKIFLEK